jgi:hypothetical protein
MQGALQYSQFSIPVAFLHRVLILCGVPVIYDNPIVQEITEIHGAIEPKGTG